MKTFEFHDNKKGKWIIPEGEQHIKWVSPIVFKCEADTIEESQKLYQEATGLEVTKQPFIGIDFK